MPSKGLHVSLWVVQGLLAAVFGMAGAMKLFMPMAELARQMVWPGDVSPLLVRFIGACELAGAVGLLLPSATRIRPVLTPAAAAGLVTVMTLAAIFHVARGEARLIPRHFTLGALAAFVAWGRFRKSPISAR